MIDFLAFDGVRTPYQDQKEALDKLSNKWSEYQCFSIVAPTASGKSALARTIQKATNAAYITANNILVNQYASTYDLPTMLGEDNYATDGAYSEAITVSLDPENHVCYNAVSFRYASRRNGFRFPKVIILDEAHSCLSLIRELVTKVYSLTKYEYFKFNLEDPEDVKKYLFNRLAEAKVTVTTSKGKKKKQIENRIFKLEDMIESIKTSPEQFAFFKSEHKGRFYFHMQPLNIPRDFIKSYFKDSKVIILSATLTQSDCQELFGGKKYTQIELPSPIKPERRPVYYLPMEEVLSYPTNTKAIAKKLDEILSNITLRPALIHVTYSDMDGIYQHLKTPVLKHNRDTKKEVLDTWLKNGGVLLAAGCSEGLDLVGDLCRLNIVTKLQFPNIGSKFWTKKIALPAGEYAYKLDTLKHVVQASGRTCRTPNDVGATILLDSRFSSLYAKLKNETPQSFKEAIVWNKVSYDEIERRAKELIDKK
jgi:energy-coupling factor transporter ATP-binding protein EcfA2